MPIHTVKLASCPKESSYSSTMTPDTMKKMSIRNMIMPPEPITCSSYAPSPAGIYAVSSDII